MIKLQSTKKIADRASLAWSGVFFLALAGCAGADPGNDDTEAAKSSAAALQATPDCPPDTCQWGPSGIRVNGADPNPDGRSTIIGSDGDDGIRVNGIRVNGPGGDPKANGTPVHPDPSEW